MKRFGKKRWGRLFLAVVVIAAGATLGGCLKDDNQVYQVSAVRALNAVPGSEPLDVFLDQNKLNFDNVAREDEAFAYADTLPYKNAWPNTRIVSIVDPADYPDAEPLVQQTVTFSPGKFYSLYVVGYEEMEVLATEDDLTSPAEGKAKIRFIHLCPDASTLDFDVETETGEEAFRADDKAFKEYTDFAPMESGTAYTVNFIDHGTEDVLHTFRFTPEAGKIYTVWVKGLFDRTADDTLGFGHGIITH